MGVSRLHFFGWAISLSADGKRLAVGSPAKHNLRGQVRVFDLSSGDDAWKQVGYDLNGPSNFDEYGNAVSLSGTGALLAVAAWRYDKEKAQSAWCRFMSLRRTIGGQWGRKFMEKR